MEWGTRCTSRIFRILVTSLVAWLSTDPKLRYCSDIECQKHSWFVEHVTITTIVVRFVSWLQRQLGAKRRPLQRNPWDTQLKVRYPVISERLLKFIEFPIGFQLRKFSLRAYPPDLSRKIEGPLLAGYCVRHSVSRMLLFISAGYCSHSWNYCYTLSGIVFNLLSWNW